MLRNKREAFVEEVLLIFTELVVRQIGNGVVNQIFSECPSFQFLLLVLAGGVCHLYPGVVGWGRGYFVWKGDWCVGASNEVCGAVGVCDYECSVVCSVCGVWVLV